MVDSLLHLSLSEATVLAFSAGVLCVFLSYLMIVFRKTPNSPLYPP
jgi:hypothetical protein